MANSSILYGNPEDSPLTSAYTGGTNWDAVGKSTKSLFNVVGDLYNAAALEAQNQRTISNLKYQFQRNKEKMIYDWRKQNASDMLSFWGSGVKSTSGSAAGLLRSNENITYSNIADMERALNEEINNLKSQTKNNWVSTIISSAGNIASAGIGLA